MLRARTFRWRALQGLAAALALATTGCAQPRPAAGALAIPPVPPGEGRIWIYRYDEPYQSLARPYVRFDGRIAGISEPGGTFYRDVPPGVYYVTVDSQGRDVNQFPEVGVAAGQQVYLEVEVSKYWDSGGDRGGWAQPTFYVYPQLPQIAVPQIAQLPFYGGS